MIYKIANSVVLDIISENSIESKGILNKNSDWNFEKRPGMLYLVVRAVSVGVNNNGDGFSEEELKKAYKTFVGKGVFVNHASNDIEKKRGVIIDAQMVEERGDKYVKCLLEINEEAFPELARMLRSGQATDFSMGCKVAISSCSICGHRAAQTSQYCMHIKHHKGGAYNGKQVYEQNHDIEFIELSAVSVGADPQAKVLEVLARKRGLDLQHLLQKAAMDPGFIDNLENNSYFSIETVIARGIRRANQLRKAEHDSN